LQTNKKLQQALQGLDSTPLMRIYAKFPVEDGTSWFHDIPRTTTNNTLRYIIPINYTNGLIMISYIDGKNALWWKQVKNKEQAVMQHLHKLFPNKVIPTPKWVRAYYWDEGAHYWTPSTSTKQLASYHNTMASINEYGYTVCGEVFSKDKHGWIEGALSSVSETLPMLRHMPFHNRIK
jgi:hypothetical protein